MTETVVYPFRFKATCEATKGPHARRYDWEGDRAEQRRWKTAQGCLVLDLDLRRSSLDPERITIAGKIEVPRKFGNLDATATAVGWIVRWFAWTLKLVYGQERDSYNAAPIPGLKVSLQALRPVRGGEGVRSDNDG